MLKVCCAYKDTMA